MLSRNMTVLASLPVLLLIWSCSPPSLLAAVRGQGIVAMVTETNNGMYYPNYVDLDLVNRDFDTCAIVGLSNFTYGEGDVFQVRPLVV